MMAACLAVDEDRSSISLRVCIFPVPCGYLLLRAPDTR